MNYHLPHNGKEQNNPAKLLDICKKLLNSQIELVYFLLLLCL